VTLGVGGDMEGEIRRVDAGITNFRCCLALTALALGWSPSLHVEGTSSATPLVKFP
jgi:hypothetical protein